MMMELVTGHGISIRFNLNSFAVAVLGAVVLLAIAGLATRQRR
jgi:uncharacterized membrane protein YeaQ/YmgE (transglycosylase-associated protein family)